MKRLIAHLRDNLILDFQGELTLEMVRQFLREDDSRDSRQLLAKLVDEKGCEDMLITLADCLVEVAQEALNDDVMRAQLRMYTES